MGDLYYYIHDLCNNFLFATGIFAKILLLHDMPCIILLKSVHNLFL